MAESLFLEGFFNNLDVVTLFCDKHRSTTIDSDDASAERFAFLTAAFFKVKHLIKIHAPTANLFVVGYEFPRDFDTAETIKRIRNRLNL